MLHGDKTDKQITPMPLSPNKNGATDRRAAPAHQSASITASKWSVLTPRVYTNLAAGDAVPHDASVPLAKLAKARNRIWVAMLAMDAAIVAIDPRAPSNNGLGAVTHNKLQKLRDKVEKVFLDYPLDVKE